MKVFVVCGLLSGLFFTSGFATETADQSLCSLIEHRIDKLNQIKEKKENSDWQTILQLQVAAYETIKAEKNLDCSIEEFDEVSFSRLYKFHRELRTEYLSNHFYECLRDEGAVGVKNQQSYRECYQQALEEVRSDFITVVVGLYKSDFAEMGPSVAACEYVDAQKSKVRLSSDLPDAFVHLTSRFAGETQAFVLAGYEKTLGCENHQGAFSELDRSAWRAQQTSPFSFATNGFKKVQAKGLRNISE